MLVLYGTWTLYCLYQFRNGDSWGAHVLAGVTLAVFTGVLGFFAVRIFILARREKKAIGDQNEAAALKDDGEQKPADKLFAHKPYMRRYGLFYDQFKTDFWWIFLPLIIYAFAKGAFIALGDGHGLIQTVGQLACEVVLLVLLLWNRPYNSKAGNVLNTIISVVRVLSVVCLIIFVEELGIAADTKTVTGIIFSFLFFDVYFANSASRCRSYCYSVSPYCCPRHMYRRQRHYRHVQGESTHKETQGA